MPGEELEPDESRPFTYCMDCGGPIWSGEPVRNYFNYKEPGSEDMIWSGAIHYFASACAQCRADSTEAENIMRAELARFTENNKLHG